MQIFDRNLNIELKILLCVLEMNFLYAFDISNVKTCQVIIWLINTDYVCIYVSKLYQF